MNTVKLQKNIVDPFIQYCTENHINKSALVSALIKEFLEKNKNSGIENIRQK